MSRPARVPRPHHLTRRPARRLAALAGAVAITLTAAACAGATPSGPVVVMSGQQSQNGALLDHLLATAGGPPVDLQITNDSDVTTAQKVLVDASSGALPDAVRVTNATYQTLVDRKLAQPVDSCLTSDPAMAAQLDPTLLDQLRIGGHLYMIPWYVTPNALVYNAELFRRAGLDPARPPATFTEMTADATAIAGLPGHPGGAVPYFGNDYNFQGYVASLGGTTIVPGATRTGIAGPVPAQVFDYFRDLAARGASPVFTNFFAQATDAFSAGNLGMFVTSASSYPSLSGHGADVRMAPVPHPDGGRALAVTSTNGFVITARDPRRQQQVCQALLPLLSARSVTQTVAATATIPLNTTTGADPNALGRVYAQHPDWRGVADQPRVPWVPLPGSGNAEVPGPLHRCPAPGPPRRTRRSGGRGPRCPRRRPAGGTAMSPATSAVTSPADVPLRRADVPVVADDDRGVVLRGLQKAYGAHAAVRDLDLAIPPGRITAVLGGSGCGKTTVLRLVAGLETPDAGWVHIDGRNVTALPPPRRGVAMVFQDDALYPSKTVADNIGFPLLMAGIGRARRRVLVREAAAAVRLEGELHRRPHQLSGGQRQRVGLARALVREPAVLLLDEPLSHLDAALRQDLRREIAALQRRAGTTMVYVTHDQAEAMAVADLLVVMRDGTVEQVGPPRVVFDRPTSTHVASFLGAMNLVRSDAADGVVCGIPGRAPAARARRGESLGRHRGPGCARRGRVRRAARRRAPRAGPLRPPPATGPSGLGGARPRPGAGHRPTRASAPLRRHHGRPPR